MKKRLFPSSLRPSSSCRLPSHDQDQWSAALAKARTIAGILEAELLQAARRAAAGLASIKGTLDTLDPHSYFLDPESFSRHAGGVHRANTTGSASRSRNRATTSSSSRRSKAGPAYRLGILPGDIISRINGETTVPLSSYDAMQKLRGEKGTKVTITIVRDGAGQAVRADNHPRGDPAPERPLRLHAGRRRRLRLHPEFRRGNAPRARRRPGQALGPGDEEPHPRPPAEHRRRRSSSASRSPTCSSRRARSSSP